jgi:hypothetical protein
MTPNPMKPKMTAPIWFRIMRSPFCESIKALYNDHVLRMTKPRTLTSRVMMMRFTGV